MRRAAQVRMSEWSYEVGSLSLAATAAKSSSQDTRTGCGGAVLEGDDGVRVEAVRGNGEVPDLGHVLPDPGKEAVGLELRRVRGAASGAGALDGFRG